MRGEGEEEERNNERRRRGEEEERAKMRMKSDFNLLHLVKVDSKQGRKRFQSQ